MGESAIEYSEHFRFFITTKLPNPHYLPEVAVKVTLLNFMITPEGKYIICDMSFFYSFFRSLFFSLFFSFFLPFFFLLSFSSFAFLFFFKGLEDQLLARTVKEERPDLASEKERLIVESADNARQLKKVKMMIRRPLRVHIYYIY